MTQDSTLSQVRRIDNNRVWIPLATSFIIIFSIAIIYWFFRGGSFKLYASAFFGLYFLTRQVWVSVLLIGILQNIFFLPLRFIGMKLSTSLKNFEDELEETKTDDEQYFLFKQKVRRGDIAVIFYIFSFMVNAIAFFSAGRIFLIDFYTQKLDPNLIYSFIPYPDYPLQGTNFNFPFFKITSSYAVEWKTVFLIWISVTVFLALLKFAWRLVRFIFARNTTILSFRIKYNRLLLFIGGFGGTLFLVSVYFLRHVPTSFSGLWLVADLTRQNTTMNFITAIGTFLTTVISGLKSHNISADIARKSGIGEELVQKVFKLRMRKSINNGFILGLGAFLVTNQIPCAFELSVATFEILYILSPFTFDKILNQASKPATTPVTDSAPTT